MKILGVPGNVEMLILFFRASFMTKTVPCGNELHKFLIWDTAGQERVSVWVVGFLGKILSPVAEGRFFCIWQDTWLQVRGTQLQ